MKVQEIIYAKKSNLYVLINDSLPKEARVLRQKKKKTATVKQQQQNLLILQIQQFRVQVNYEM